MNRAIKYTAVLIGLYIVAANGSKMGSVFKDGANGGATFVKTLQGR